MKHYTLFTTLALISGCSALCPEPPNPLEPQAYFTATTPVGRDLACYPRRSAVPVCVPVVEAYEGEWADDFAGEGL